MNLSTSLLYLIAAILTTQTLASPNAGKVHHSTCAGSAYSPTQANINLITNRLNSSSLRPRKRRRLLPKLPLFSVNFQMRGGSRIASFPFELDMESSTSSAVLRNSYISNLGIDLLNSWWKEVSPE
ncbi:unnamed protein product [Zymoseptoria tritici ST99CH_3D7]|uniref:Uncharacterized protein n=1 Tax=Zymoseptoria tritici (strain ST99CH_3D7) TaxID=1276538 RepID=A0A1X7RCF4_ZYMT9|nr:unnamed protein product [Zymoseptoria tritici ST99CH_3D7]